MAWRTDRPADTYGAPPMPSAMLDAAAALGPEHAPPDRELEHWKRW